MKNNMKENIWHRLFNLYLWLSGWGKRTQQRSRVYDHLGIIDTLGHSSDETFFTSSYDEELGSMFSIKLPLRFRINLISYCGEKSITITKV